METTLRSFGRLDVLVNNAGIAILKRTEDLTLADWNRQIATNLTSVFIGSRSAMEQMKACGGGSIINMSSVAGLVGMKRCVAYGASKGGVRAMSKSIAIDGAEHNVRCNSVHPGLIWTNMQAAAVGSNSITDARVSPGGTTGRRRPLRALSGLRRGELCDGSGIHRRCRHDRTVTASAVTARC
jgi:NAD(P)-dependent dehydrogenase (short-subunit alcohol dehydrogenase family)